MNINMTNRVVGFLPFHIGFRKSSPVNFNNIFNKLFIENSKYIEENFPLINETIIKCATNYREVYSGSPDSNTNHLKDFLSDNTEKVISTEEMLRIVMLGDFIQVPSVNYSNPYEMIYCTNFNSKSTNGIMTSRIVNSQSKGYSIDMCTKIAIDKYRIIREKPFKNFCLWELLSREKDFDISKKDNLKKLSTRVVMSTEHHETILLSWIISKFMDSYKLGTSNGNGRRSFEIDGEFDGTKAHLIKTRLSNYDYYLDADWSAFDSTITTQELELCGAIMFSESVTKREDLRLFFHVISSFCTKYIAIPPGIVVELNKGNPSGHPGVTAVNCFVNLIRWSLIGYKIYGDNYSSMMDILVYGDDAIIGFKENPNLWKIDSIIKELNYKSDPLAEKLYPVPLMGAFIDEGPDFLKRRFGGVSISWNLKKIFDKIIYQSKVRTIDEQIDLLINYAETGPGIIEFNNFVKFIINKYLDSYDVDIDKDKIINRLNSLDEYRFIIKKNNNLLKEWDSLLKISSINIQVNLQTIKLIYQNNKFKYNNEQARMLLFTDFNPNLLFKNKRIILNKLKISYNKSIIVSNNGMVTYNREIFRRILKADYNNFCLKLKAREKPT
jgi:hypothetical protein